MYVRYVNVLQIPCLLTSPPHHAINWLMSSPSLKNMAGSVLASAHVWTAIYINQLCFIAHQKPLKRDERVVGVVRQDGHNVWQISEDFLWR